MGTAPSLLITEIADPSNTRLARFLELYSPEGITFGTHVRLARWNGKQNFANKELGAAHIAALPNRTIAPGGFFVVCVVDIRLTVM